MSGGLTSRSETDLALFQNLSNPAAIDLEATPRSGRDEPSQPQSQPRPQPHPQAQPQPHPQTQAFQRTHESVHPQVDFEAFTQGGGGGGGGVMSAFRQRVQEKLNENATNYGYRSQVAASRAPTNISARTRGSSLFRQRVQQHNEGEAAAQQSAHPPPFNAFSNEAARMREAQAMERPPGEAYYEEADDARQEKQILLIELRKLESQGVVLTRRFTMEDSLFEMKLELEKQKDSQDTVNTVSFMRDSMCMILSSLEMLNNRFGPFLAIDGWAETVTRDPSRYNHALERLYKRYWRKAQPSPIMELSWLIIGSMIMFHFKNKMGLGGNLGLGGLGAASQPTAGEQPANGPQQPPMPAQPSQPAQPSPPPASNQQQPQSFGQRSYADYAQRLNIDPRNFVHSQPEPAPHQEYIPTAQFVPPPLGGDPPPLPPSMYQQASTGLPVTQAAAAAASTPRGVTPTLRPPSRSFYRQAQPPQPPQHSQMPQPSQHPRVPQASQHPEQVQHVPMNYPPSQYEGDDESSNGSDHSRIGSISPEQLARYMTSMSGSASGGASGQPSTQSASFPMQHTPLHNIPENDDNEGDYEDVEPFYGNEDGDDDSLTYSNLDDDGDNGDSDTKEHEYANDAGSAMSLAISAPVGAAA